MADATDKKKWLNRTVLGVGLTSLQGLGHEAANPNTREIDGTAEVNGQSGFTYRVIVADNDQPGVNDSFWIQVWGPNAYSYSAGGNLGGGEIQLHKPCH